MRVKRELWFVLAVGLSGCSGLPCEGDAAYLDARQPPAPELPAGFASRPLVDLDAVPASSPASRDSRKRGDGTCLSAPPRPALDKGPSPEGG